MNLKQIIKEEMDNSFDWANDVPAIVPLTKVNAEIGLKVKIRGDSQWHSDSDGYRGDYGGSNPDDMFGEIIDINGGNEGYPIYVKWDNGKFNDYRHKDLDVY